MKQKTIMWLAHAACLLLLTFSCRKMDRPVTREQDAAVAARFLELPATASPEIRRVAATLATLNRKAGFLNAIAAQAGYPVWNTAIYHTPPLHNGRTTTAAPLSADTLLYIPLVLDGTQRVSAFLYARLDGTVHLQLHQAKNYARYGFGSIAQSTHNAERLALQIMVLDRQVFGYTNFDLLDDRLFRDSSLIRPPADSTSRQLQLQATTAASHSGRTTGGHWEEGTVTHCVRTDTYTAPHRLTGVVAGEPHFTCTTTVQYYFVADDEDPDTGGSGNGGGGGGGGGGTPPSGPEPCNPTPELDNGLPPCPRGGSDGWIPQIPPKNPCDQVKAIVSDTANTSFMQKVKALATTQNLGLNYEKTAVLIEGNPPVQKEDSGAVNNASAQLPDIPGQQYLTFAHTHPDVPGGTYSVFSFGDLRRMSMLLHNGQLDDNKFVAFLSTYKGTHYALTIYDKAKFEAFFYYFNNTGNAADGNILKWMHSHQKARSVEDKYFKSKDNALITEMDPDNSNVLSKFLDFMKEADLGVTLFESSSNFDIFTKVEKQQDGTITRSGCN